MDKEPASPVTTIPGTAGDMAPFRTDNQQIRVSAVTVSWLHRTIVSLPL